MNRLLLSTFSLITILSTVTSGLKLLIRNWLKWQQRQRREVIMTHDELCTRADRYLRSNGFGVAFHDKFRAYSGTGELPDAIGFRNGVSCLIEVKCSRSDFHADKKKHFRINPAIGMGDWRFFMCEPGIIDVVDLPAGWGLLHVKGNRVLKVHGWPPNSWWFSQKPLAGNKQAECDFMYSALRRMVVRGHFNEIYDGVPVAGGVDG